MSHDDVETASIEHWHKMWLQQSELTRKAQNRCSRLVDMGDELRAENKKLSGQLKFANKVNDMCARTHEECQLPSVLATSDFPREVKIQQEIYRVIDASPVVLLEDQIIETILDRDDLDFHGPEIRNVLHELMFDGHLLHTTNGRIYLGDID